MLGKKPMHECALTYGWLDRCRWNVLDLITIIGRNAVATTLFCDVDMSWAETLRGKLLACGSRVTETAILLKAIGIAQRAHPDSRSILLPWGRVVTLGHIVAGFTVERFVRTHPAVFLGTIESPDIKPLEQIMSELQQYSECSITEHPQLEIERRFSEMPWLFRRLVFWLGLNFPAFRIRHMGASFGLTSLGKYGVKALTGPCVCTSTFGVGAVEDRPAVLNGKVIVRPTMTLSLLFDHRVIDGAAAARFLRDVKELVEGGLEEYLPVEGSKNPNSNRLISIHD